MIPDLIYDVGMHDGSDSAFYLAKGYKVVGIEANPELCRSAQNRFNNEFSRGRIAIVNQGIGDTAQTVKFGIDKTVSDQSSFSEHFINSAIAQGHEFEFVDLQVRPLDDFFAAYGVPYYCKIDIEGYDEMCVRALERAKELPKFVSTEATVPNFAKRMSTIGYGRFKMISQLWHQMLPMPFPPKEGAYIDIVTNDHMSGPFGDETYGPWLTLEEFEDEYLKCAKKIYDSSLHAALGCPPEVFNASWFDFHAMLGR